jgi:hypothetical protein
VHRLIVLALLRACDLTDWLRLDYLTHRHRLSEWALALDDRWNTGVWERVTR